MEWLIESTMPSLMACSTAATMSVVADVTVYVVAGGTGTSTLNTLYMMMAACGATPEMRGNTTFLFSVPSASGIGTLSSTLPAAVDATCVPWPPMSLYFQMSSLLGANVPGPPLPSRNE